MLLVVCFALFIRGALGFGDGLIAVPLISLVWSVKEAVPVILLLSMLTSVVAMWRERQFIQVASLQRTGITALCAFPLGIFALSWLDESSVRLCLGIALVALTLVNLLEPQRFQLSHPAWSYPFGFLAGFLGGAYALRGIVFAVYGSLRGWSPKQLRATLHSFYLVTGVGAPFAFWITGLLNARVLSTIGLLILPSLLAGLWGQRVAERLSPSFFRKFLWWMVGFIGVWLVVQSHLM